MQNTMKSSQSDKHKRKTFSSKEKKGISKIAYNIDNLYGTQVITNSLFPPHCVTHTRRKKTVRIYVKHTSRIKKKSLESSLNGLLLLLVKKKNSIFRQRELENEEKTSVVSHLKIIFF